MELGPTPAGESCEQLGLNYNHGNAMKELRAYRNQLQRMFPTAQLGIKSFPHDFGTYHEVVVYFDDCDGESVTVAYDVEANLPESWDNEAMAELEKEAVQ